MTVPPGTQIGRYRILGKIGSGASGAVYRAQDPTIGRVIALKLLDADPIAASAVSSDHGWQAERFFKREAEAAGSLSHPNIVTLYDAGSHEAFFYLAMELIDGETIATEIARDGHLSEARTIEIGIAVADALHYAHFRGVVHRDVKPANLICRRDGAVKVSDFGIARLVGLAASQSTGQLFVGTPAYASPEAIQGGPVDGRSDQFSLGIVLYLAATGRHPFPAEGIPATIYAILSSDPADPRTIVESLSPALSEIIRRTLRRDPGERFSDCAELARALRTIRGGADLERTKRLPRGNSSTRPRFARIATVGAFVVTAALGGAVALRWARPGSVAPGIGGGAGSRVAAVDDAVTLGVVPFKGLSGESPHGWVRDALRDGLNTELSQLSRVRVYSKEFLDFLVERKRLTEIEAMNELGIQKMLSGSVWANEDRLHAEAFITDVSSGVLEGSVSADGSTHDFADLRSQLVLRVIERLRLPITADERTALETRQRVPVDPLRLLLEAEGGSGGSVEAPAARNPDRTSRIWRSLFSPHAAFAASEGSNDADGATRERILALLELYRRATEKGDFPALSQVYTEFSRDQQEAMQRYLEVTRDLQVSISDVELRVVGDDAVVSYTRTDEFVDQRSGKSVRIPVRLTKTLRHEPVGWRILPRNETR